jgi:hypothetical protein
MQDKAKCGSIRRQNISTLNNKGSKGRVTSYTKPTDLSISGLTEVKQWRMHLRLVCS